MERRLCLFTDSLVPSGVGEHMLDLGANLARAYRVSFVCPPSPAGIALLDRAGALGLETLPLEVPGAGAPNGALIAWLRDRRFDIFHVHAGIAWEGHEGTYAARAAGVPIVVRTEHLPNVLLIHRSRLEEYGRMAALVDRLICVSEEGRSTFEAIGIHPGKLRTVRNGIGLLPAPVDARRVRARVGMAAQARIVLTVGRLTTQKGHRYLIEAIPKVLESEPRAEFLLVGEGPLEPDLRGRAAKLGIEQNVRFLGHRRDVPQLLAASDLFVLPSLFEGLPLALLEAMAAGLPVVAARACGIKEVVQEGATGRLVPVQDPGALTDAILEVLGGGDLGRLWGAAGRSRVERDFSAATMANSTTGIYEELIAEKDGIRWTSPAA